MLGRGPADDDRTAAAARQSRREARRVALKTFQRDILVALQDIALAMNVLFQDLRSMRRVADQTLVASRAQEDGESLESVVRPQLGWNCRRCSPADCRTGRQALAAVPGHRLPFLNGPVWQGVPIPPPVVPVGRP
jgi:hypothetical protein